MLGVSALGTMIRVIRVSVVRVIKDRLIYYLEYNTLFIFLIFTLIYFQMRQNNQLIAVLVSLCLCE